MDQTYMKEKPIFPLLMSLAFPMMITMLVNSLYNIVDSMFVAKISEDAMAALSLVYPVQNLIISIAVGFGVGMNAMIALFLGAGEKDRADAAATQGLVLNLIHGVVLSIAGIAIIPGFLRMFTEDRQVIQMGCDYGFIVFSFSVIIMASVTFEKLYQAIGKMVLTMAAMLSGCIVNIILDPVMIFGLGPVPAMGIQGAAWATGIGQTVTLLVFVIAYVRYPITVTLKRKYMKPEKGICTRFYAIGIPATLNMALPSLLVSVLNGILAGFSQSYVVVLGVYYKLQSFLYLPANGIVQGMRPLISYNYGAKEGKRVRKIYRTALGLIAAIMGTGTLLCQGIPGVLIGLFTENAETITAGTTALRVICMGFVVSAVSVTTAGALEAFGKGLQSFVISLLRYVIIMIPAAFLLSRVLGPSGVWHGFWIAELLTALAAFGIYKKEVR